MKAHIVHQTPNALNHRRNTIKVYCESSGDELIQDFFYENIAQLGFKCKTWSKLTRFVNKLTSAAIKEHFPDKSLKSLRFSHKCGCSCGCSPGWNVKFEGGSESKYPEDVWMSTTCSVEDTAAINLKVERLIPELKLEIESHASD